MNTHSRWVLPKRQDFGRGLGISFIFLLLASALNAEEQDVNFDSCPNDDHTIEATAGDPFSPQVIAALNAADVVTWSFDAVPNCTGADLIDTDPETYECPSSGMIITLSGFDFDPVLFADESIYDSPVVWADTGGLTAEPAFTFTLEADDGSDSCMRTYEVVITEPVDTTEPFDVVLVLDRSGSMGTSVDTDTTRWDALKAGVEIFMLVLQSSTCSESRFAMTLFEGELVVLDNLDLSSLFFDVDDLDLAGYVATELGDQNPSGLTAMGTGLLDGIGKLDDDARPRVVMLFTDGRQNQSPEVDIYGTTIGGDTIDPGGTGSFKIVPVAIDNPSGDFHTTLQNLASEYEGTLIETDIGTDIEGALADAVTAVLDECSPQMVASYEGTLSGSVTLPAFDLNKRVGQLLIHFSFSRDFDIPTLLAALRIEQNGIDVTSFFQPVFVDDFTSSILLKTDFVGPELPFVRGPSRTPVTISQEGSYSIEIVDLDEDLDYRVFAYADDHRLDMDWEVSPAAPRVNQPFHPTMRLSWRGDPVTNANVTAIIGAPRDDLGDALARNRSSVVATNTPDPSSPGYQKYLALLNDPNFVAQVATEPQELTLTHQGGGIYSAPYNPADVSGVYQVLYRVSAEDPVFGKVQRVVRQSVYVRFGEVDLEQSEVDTNTSSKPSDLWTVINFRPMTTDGRFLGPAQDRAFSVVGAGITLASIDDDQFGGYTIKLDGDPDNQICFRLLDDRKCLYEGRAADFGPDGFPDCNANGVDDAIDVASGFSRDRNANGVPDECEVICYFNGIARGGRVSLTITGLSQTCTVAITTSAGESAAGVAARLAAALESDLCLAAQRLTTTVSGTTVTITGFGLDPDSFTAEITDPGLAHNQVPTLSQYGLAVLALLFTLALGALVLRRAHQQSQEP